MNKIKLIILGILAFVVLGNCRQVMAFGISPSGIYNDRLRPGSKFEQSFTISRSDTDNEDLVVLIEPDLSEMTPWFTYEPSQSFDFPGDKSEVKLTIKINVPTDAPLKSYDGFIRVKASTKEKNSGVAIVKGVRMEVNLLTTNFVVSDLLIRSMRFGDVKEGEPLRLYLTIENKGNTAVGPSNATVEILNLNQEPIGTLSTDKADKIEANQTKDIVMEMPLTVALGANEYFGIAKVYLGDKVLRQERLVFRVLEKAGKDVDTKAVPAQKTAGLFGNVDGTWLTILWYLLLIIGVSLLILLAMFPKKIQGKLRGVILVVSLLCLLIGVIMLVSTKPSKPAVMKTNDIIGVSPTIPQEVLPTSEITVATPSGLVKGAKTKLESPALPMKVSDPRGNVYYIYENPDLSSRPVYAAVQGEEFQVISEKSDWFYVSMKDGTFGWLSKSSVKDQTTTETP